jgi:uncharacterized protein
MHPLPESYKYVPDSGPAVAACAPRPWPPGPGPWVMRMRWNHLLFAHWPVKAQMLRPLVPSGLEIDTYEGEAWVGVVPFRMSRTRGRFTPPLPGLSAFPELNVRTYVTAQGKPGVWFFSLDAASKLAVRGARWGFHLPYFDADMQVDTEASETRYRSRRTHRDSPPAEFVGNYRPTGDVFQAAAGSLEDFLTARYCLYAANKKGRLYRDDISHVPWPLQAAEAQIERNSMAQAAGIQLPDCKPLLHYASVLDVVAWMIQGIT